MIIHLFKSPHSQPCFIRFLVFSNTVRNCKPVPKASHASALWENGYWLLILVKGRMQRCDALPSPAVQTTFPFSPFTLCHPVCAPSLVCVCSSDRMEWGKELVGDRAGDSCMINPGYHVDHKGYICTVVNLLEMKAPAPESNANLRTIRRQEKTTKGYSFLKKYTSDHIPL